MKGDYQAQRNIAYGYTATGPEVVYNGQTRNPILGCAWYLVVLHSGSPQVGQGDVGNKQLYCDKRLDRDSQAAAAAQARELFQRIYKKPAKF